MVHTTTNPDSGRPRFDRAARAQRRLAALATLDALRARATEQGAPTLLLDRLEADPTGVIAELESHGMPRDELDVARDRLAELGYEPPRPLTVCIVEDANVSDPRTLETILQAARDCRYALHLRAASGKAATAVRSLGLPLTVEKEPRDFWTDARVVLVTDQVVQADVRVQTGVTTYEGDWAVLRQQIEAAAGTGGTVVLRFDHVCHDRRGWQDGQLQEPVPGMPANLRLLLADPRLTLVVSTQRASQLADIAKWFEGLDLPAVPDSVGMSAQVAPGRLLVTSRTVTGDLYVEASGRAVSIKQGQEAVMAYLAAAHRSMLGRFRAQDERALHEG